MPHPPVIPFAYTAYVVAGMACLLVIASVLVRLSLACVRREAPKRQLARQELVWTLVPALVLMGLTIIGEIPQGWGKIVREDIARETPSPSR